MPGFSPHENNCSDYTLAQNNWYFFAPAKGKKIVLCVLNPLHVVQTFRPYFSFSSLTVPSCSPPLLPPPPPLLLLDPSPPPPSDFPLTLVLSLDLSDLFSILGRFLIPAPFRMGPSLGSARLPPPGSCLPETDFPTQGDTQKTESRLTSQLFPLCLSLPGGDRSVLFLLVGEMSEGPRVDFLRPMAGGERLDTFRLGVGTLPVLE